MTTETSLTLELLFNESAQFGRFLREAAGDPSLRRQILRARVTPNGGWMTVKLRGPAGRIEALAGAWRDRIASASAA